MGKKPSKRQFDWKSYSRPARLLTPEQEEAFSAGILKPVIELALNDASLRMDIRSKMANLYYRGVNLCRILGDQPSVAELDDPCGSGSVERMELHDPAAVSQLVERIAAARKQLDASRESTEATKREYLQTIAESNSYGDLYDLEFLIADMEYTYGQRRYDLVALKRTTGVTGPGGFANPRLCFMDVRVRDQRLDGSAGLDAMADDFADFMKALGSSHVDRARQEFLDLAQQKARLGLLEPLPELRGIDDRMPEYLVLFADYTSLAEARHDAAIVALHERLASRHYPIELLRFAVLPDFDGKPSPSLVIKGEDVMTYRELKEYRRS